MTIASTRTSARVLLVAALVTGMFASSSRIAEAQDPGYFVQIAPSVAEFIGWTSGGTAVWYTTGGLEVGASGAGALAAGGVTIAAGTAAVAASAGVLIGWGVVESGLWDWAFGEDPLPATSLAGWTSGQDTTSVNTTEYAQYGTAVVAASQRNGTDTGTNYTLSWTVNNAAYNIRFACSQHAWPDVWTGTLSTGSTQNGTRNLNMTCVDPNVAGWFAIRPSSAEAPWELTRFTFSGEGVAEDRRLHTEATCKLVATGATTTVDGFSPWYAPGSEPPTPRVQCPDGYTLTGASVTREVDGQPEEDLALVDYQAPPLTPTDPYADCYDGSCELMIHQLRNGVLVRCDVDEANCLGWWDYVSTHPDTDLYECMWGTHVMPFSDCEMFREIDSPEWTGPKTDPAAPATTPGTAANPAKVDDGCGVFGGLNPFKWLARGVACALEWAFVPSSATATQADALGQTLATKAPFGTVTQAVGWFQDASAVGSECWTQPLTVPGYSDVPVIETCSQSGVWGYLHQHRGLLSVVVHIGFFAPLAWWAWRVYAPGTIQGG